MQERVLHEEADEEDSSSSSSSSSYYSGSSTESSSSLGETEAYSEGDTLHSAQSYQVESTHSISIASSSNNNNSPKGEQVGEHTLKDGEESSSVEYFDDSESPSFAVEPNSSSSHEEDETNEAGIVATPPLHVPETASKEPEIVLDAMKKDDESETDRQGID